MEFLSNYELDLSSAISDADSIVSAINSVGAENLSNLCGNNAAYFTGISTAIASFSSISLNQLRLIAEGLIGPGGLLSCEFVLPVYSASINNNICGDLMETWNSVFIFLIILTITLIIMFSVRPFGVTAKAEPALVVEEGVEVELDEKQIAIVGDEGIEKSDGESSPGPSNIDS